MRATCSAARVGGMVGLLGLWLATSASAGDRPEAKSKGELAALGREIFNREWLPGDSRSHGGDGLGPAFNDTSCVACHNAGGGGGAGPLSKNIDILAASRLRGMMPPQPAPVQTLNLPPTGRVAPGAACPPGPPPAPDELVAVHAGFKDGRTVVLHKFGIDPNYEAWRDAALQSGFGVSGVVVGGGFDGTNFEASVAPTAFGRGRSRIVPIDTFEAPPQLIGGGRSPFDQPGDPAGPAQAAAVQRLNAVRMATLNRAQTLRQPSRNIGGFAISRSQRSPTALFGLGLVDSIPEAVLVAEAKRQEVQSPTTRGRVARLKDGRAGRLGWKGQIANAEDFVLNACAVELGLEVPGHRQSVSPLAPRYRADGLDLTAEECDALTAYVRDLPRPEERMPAGDREAKVFASGKATLARVGCTGCHTPSLGNVEGIYSDVLLHDMGVEMADAGSYGDSSSEDDEEPLIPPALASLSPQDGGRQAARRLPLGATKGEWRTPPLWGFRDSGPYLHDGRAETLEQAVALHGGQGGESSMKFFALTPAERREVEAFLKSLVAPGGK